MTKISLGVPDGCISLTLKKISLLEGKESGIKPGKVRQINVEKMPEIGSQIIGVYVSEHSSSGDPKTVRFPATTKVQDVKKTKENTLEIYTQTSVYEGRVN